MSSTLSCFSNHWFNALSSLIVTVLALTFNSFGTSSSKLISLFYSLLSSNFSNFFLLNKCINSQMYSGKSSGFVWSSSFPISYCSLFMSSIGYILLVFDVNAMSWYWVLYSFKYIVNCIVILFQFTSELCFAN